VSEHEILPDEALTPEELELRKKGQAMADFIGGCIEDYMQTHPLTEDRVRAIVREMFDQMIEPAAARISESVKQMIESMEDE
jgi:predicted Zn-dependent protease